jgi:hypothetical protein
MLFSLQALTSHCFIYAKYKLTYEKLFKSMVNLTDNMVEIFNISIGMELLSIRSSDIAFTMGAKGPLLEKADNFDGVLEVF